jgi:hypothetical protein
MRTRDAVLATALLVALTACSSSSTTAARSPATSTPTAAATAATGVTTSAAGTVWICPPDRAAAACTTNLDATIVGRTGAPTRAAFVPAQRPPADCFYVYPTVSQAAADNAPRTAAPEVLDAIHAQAALFSSVCHVIVPAYRQVTLRALLGGRYDNRTAQATAYADVLSAWQDYLAHSNHGRPFVLIGHSQGAYLLTKLIRTEIDRTPALRGRLLSAILLGANVTVPVGRDVGGDFTAVPACRRPGQRGCVIAYSSFASTPPPLALFGRTTLPGRQVLCTDPSALVGGRGVLRPYVPTNRVTTGPQALPGTGFVEYTGALRGSCRSAGGATWLQVAPVPGGRLPAFQESLGPVWGLHIADVNLALGDLVEVVRRQEAGS